MVVHWLCLHFADKCVLGCTVHVFPHSILGSHTVLNAQCYHGVAISPVGVVYIVHVSPFVEGLVHIDVIQPNPDLHVVERFWRKKKVGFTIFFENRFAKTHGAHPPGSECFPVVCRLDYLYSWIYFECIVRGSRFTFYAANHLFHMHCLGTRYKLYILTLRLGSRTLKSYYGIRQISG